MVRGLVNGFKVTNVEELVRAELSDDELAVVDPLATQVVGALY